MYGVHARMSGLPVCDIADTGTSPLCGDPCPFSWTLWHGGLASHNGNSNPSRASGSLSKLGADWRCRCSIATGRARLPVLGHQHHHHHSSFSRLIDIRDESIQPPPCMKRPRERLKTLSHGSARKVALATILLYEDNTPYLLCSCGPENVHPTAQTRLREHLADALCAGRRPRRLGGQSRLARAVSACASLCRQPRRSINYSKSRRRSREHRRVLGADMT